jgi:hypothetical protein
MSEEGRACRIEQKLLFDHTDESSDKNIDESEDADIIPGCCVLHFDDSLIPYKSIWVSVSVFMLGANGIVLTNLVGRIHPNL